MTETPDLLVARAYAHLYLQDYAGALADFAMADKIAPKSDAVKSNRAEFDRVRVASEGIRFATEQLAKNPKDFAALTQRAYWYLSLGPSRDSVGKGHFRCQYRSRPCPG